MNVGHRTDTIGRERGCMSDLRYPLWQQTVRLAEIESNPETRRQRIKTARIAIEQRYVELQEIPDENDERMALKEALDALSTMEQRRT